MATINKTFSVKNGLDVANTIVIDSNRNLSNIAQANVTGAVNVGGTDLFAAVNSAANTVSTSNNGTLVLADANLNFNSSATVNVTAVANGTSQVNLSFTANTTALNLPGMNAAFASINSAFASQNSGDNTQNTTFGVVNSTFATINSTFATINSSIGTGVSSYANGTLVLTSGNLNFVNTATLNVGISANGTGQTNISFSVNSTAIGLPGYNTALASINTALASVNTALTSDNAAFVSTNSAFGTINTYIGTVNTALASINTALASDNSAFVSINSALSTINAEFLPLTGGTITGNLTVSANLFVVGNLVSLNVGNITTNDAILYLASNNVTDGVDIGFIANAHDSVLGAQQTGLIRHATGNLWYLFEGLAGSNIAYGPTINVAQTNVSTLVANIQAPLGATITMGTNVVATQANVTLVYNALSSTNSAFASINTALASDNTAFGLVNTALSTTNSTFGTLNTSITSITAALTSDNSAFGLVNTALATHNTTFGTLNTNITTASTQVSTYANGNLVLTSGNLNFNNTATVNVAITANGTGQSNVAFGLNTSAITGTTNFTSNITINQSSTKQNVFVNTATTALTTQIVVDTIATNSFLWAEYKIVQSNGAPGTSGVVIHSTTVTVVTDGTNTYMEEHNAIQTGPNLGSFSSTVTGGNMQLLWTPTGAQSTGSSLLQFTRFTM